MGADAPRTRKFRCGVVDAAQTDGLGMSAPPGEIGERIDGSLGAAELIDERAERRRTDILAAQQP